MRHENVLRVLEFLGYRQEECPKPLNGRSRKLLSNDVDQQLTLVDTVLEARRHREVILRIHWHQKTPSKTDH